MDMNSDSMREHFGFVISRLSRIWRRQLDARLVERGISYARWITLVYLKRGGEGMQQKELADYMGIEAPSLVRTLDHLERLDLIERRLHPADRRAKAVHLTAAAARDLEAFSEVARSVRGDLLAHIDDADLVVCLRVIETIIDNARQLDAAADAHIQPGKAN